MILYCLIYFAASLCWLLFFTARRVVLKFSTIIKAFLCGIVSAPIAGSVTYLLQSNFLLKSNIHFSLSEFLLQFCLIGPIEELSKFFGVFIIAHKKNDFSNAYDGILLAISVALGFACIENVLYLFAFGLKMTIPRLLLGNIGHATYSMFWGYALGVVMHEDAYFSTLGFGLLIASIFHGAYNYFLNFSIFGAIISLIITISLFAFLLSFLRSERKNSIRKHI